MLAPHLPLEIIDIILQYDGRIKYRNGEFVNVIHPNLLKMYSALIVPLLKKKININKSIKYKTHEYFINVNDDPLLIRNRKIEEAFYFEFDFDNLSGVGLSYDYCWFSNDFKVSYFDDRRYL